MVNFRNADDWFVVVLAYVLAFLPWALVTAFDYISEKWRSIRWSLRAGGFHTAITLLPLGYAVYYADLQRSDGDFKEMMAAVVAIFLCFYHIIRTVWGLVQLKAYCVWCRDVVKKMKVLGMKVDDRDVERKCRVNSTVVDNELGGVDISVSITPCFSMDVSKWLATDRAGLCTVRWVGAFLCAYGRYWNPGTRKPELEALFDQATQSIGSLLDVTNTIDAGKDTSGLFSISEDLEKRGEVNLRHGAYECNVENFELFDTFKRYRVEFENLLGSYPSTGERTKKERRWLRFKKPIQQRKPVNQYSNDRDFIVIQLVDAVMIAKHLDINKLECIREKSSKFRFPTDGMAQKGWRILLEQWKELPPSFENFNYDSVPKFPWGMLMIPLWDSYPNWRVLSATAHRDIQIALTAGDELKTLHVEFERSPKCHFDECREKIGSSGSLDNCFVGAALESVRSFFAEWLRQSKSNPASVDWDPDISSSAESFEVSKYLGIESSEIQEAEGESMELSLFYRRRLVWECQHILRDRIAKQLFDESNGMMNTGLQKSHQLMMLFITAFPILKIVRVKDGKAGDRDLTIEINPGVAVQNIWLELRVTGRHAKLLLLHDLTISKFQWKNWIDAAMGVMSGYDKCRADNDIPFHKRRFTKVNLRGEMKQYSSPHPGVEYLPQDVVHVWQGWPVFDERICQFELNQWVHACGLNLQTENFDFTTRQSMDMQIELAQRSLVEIHDYKAIVSTAYTHSEDPV